MFFVLGFSILLVALLVLNNGASLIAVAVWRIFGRRLESCSAQRASRTLFLLRILPAALSIAATFFLFAPAYLRHESRVGHEEVSIKLVLLASLSTIAIAIALARGIATWRATARLTAGWLRNSEPVQIPGIKVPAFKVEHPFPLIAVVGAFQPRLFIANQIFQSLTPAELTAALAHETGHIKAHDNLKRSLVRMCRDLVLVPVGRRLDRAWLQASEAAADEFAARRDRRTSLDLASAVLKIARMIPPGVSPAMTAGAFLAAEDDKGFSIRVQRLLRLADCEDPDTRSFAWVSQLPILIPVALTLLFVVLIGESHILAATHAVIEHAVYILD
jgi:Zn-dependent protease with chaperone function